MIFKRTVNKNNSLLKNVHLSYNINNIKLTLGYIKEGLTEFFITNEMELLCFFVTSKDNIEKNLNNGKLTVGTKL